jgi:mRNA interferase RelE/StbE
MYRVSLSESAAKELERLPLTLQQRTIARIRTLAIDPRPRGCIKLEGEKNKWRVRVSDYRILYFIFDATREVKIAAILPRDKAYR